MNTYYFYNRLHSKDGIRVEPYLITKTPSLEQLNKLDYCISKSEFVELPGYTTFFMVNFKNKKLETYSNDNKIFRLEQESVESVKTDLELDFRLTAIEHAIELPTILPAVLLRASNPGARSVYEMLLIIIKSNNYNKADIELKINLYTDPYKKLTIQEKEYLIQLMESTESGVPLPLPLPL